MNEIIKEWLKQLYEQAIVDTKIDISNNHLWELGYDGEEPNPHTEAIELLKEYIEVLKELKEGVK